MLKKMIFGAMLLGSIVGQSSAATVAPTVLPPSGERFVPYIPQYLTAMRGLHQPAVRFRDIHVVDGCVGCTGSGKDTPVVCGQMFENGFWIRFVAGFKMWQRGSGYDSEASWVITAGDDFADEYQRCVMDQIVR